MYTLSRLFLNKHISVPLKYKIIKQKQLTIQVITPREKTIKTLFRAMREGLLSDWQHSKPLGQQRQ